jgi:hypothetical protein
MDCKAGMHVAKRIYTLTLSGIEIIYILSIQRDTTMPSILFISLQIYCTCFGCQLHPLSRVQETVVVDHTAHCCISLDIYIYIYVYVYRVSGLEVYKNTCLCFST